MSQIWVRFVALACLGAPAVFPYGRLKTASGGLLHRPDFAAIQFEINQLAVPGLANSAGQTFITGDSDLMGAFTAAAAQWSSVPTSAVRFLPPVTTTLQNAVGDSNNVVQFLDTPAIRSALGPSVAAVTVATFFDDGTIADSDILFNPVFTFSTTGTPNTFDIQSILTHELGHSLGANHSGVLGASMYAFVAQNSTICRSLSADDVAFATAVYPAAATIVTGGIAGTLTLNGMPLRSALVNALETTSGIVVSAMTSAVDGTYSMTVPPGSYVLFAQPLTGNLAPGTFYLTTADAVDTGFRAGFPTSSTSPIAIPVTAGNMTNGDFSPPAAGDPGVNLQFFHTAAAGGFGDQGMLLGTQLPQAVVSGQTVDFILLGPGIDANLTAANILMPGPVTLAPGSIRPDAFLDGNTLLPYIRMTVTIAPVTSPMPITLIVMKDGLISSYTGGIVLLPPM